MITISQLRNLNKKNGGHFFDRGTMKFFGDTLRSFGIKKVTDTTVKLARKKAVRRGEIKSWSFDATTGLIISVEKSTTDA